MKTALRMFPAIVWLWIVFSTLPAISQEAYKFELAWGSPGAGDGQFNGPTGVAVDSSGNVYVADMGNHRIQKFDPNGNYIIKWGSYGPGDNQFASPERVTVDSLGNVYVADAGNIRIQKFDSSGNFISMWGGYGIGDGDFKYISGVAVNALGYVYVTDRVALNPRIQKFDSDGHFITKWGSRGTGEGQFQCPSGIAFDQTGNVYVVDTCHPRVQKFDSNGKFLANWGTYGSGDNQFASPYGIAVDISDYVYVADTSNNRIQKADTNGNLITKWGSEGSDESQFIHPEGIAVDTAGNVYVADTGNNRIQKFSMVPSSIILDSPATDAHFNSCSSSSPSIFSWNVSESFSDYEIQFSPDYGFTSIAVRVRAQTISVTIESNSWEEIMMIPGASGGTIYWRVVGTRPDDTTEISGVRSLVIGAEPAGNPIISPTVKRSKPTLTWQSNCNTKFKVWFGNDSSFSKKTYSFEVETPNDGNGAVSKTLKPLEWLRIKILARNKTGSTLYWYVESWDVLGMYAKTDVMSFVLID